MTSRAMKTVTLRGKSGAERDDFIVRLRADAARIGARLTATPYDTDRVIITAESWALEALISEAPS